MQQALAAFRASQLRYLAPYTTQWKLISSSPWLLNTEEPQSSTTPSPPRHPSSSLVPVTNHQRNLFPSITEIVASAIHRLVLLVTSLRRVSANEIYVRRVLQQQLGIHPLELDLLSLHHPDVFRLSVRHSIEPVVGYLRSQGLTGSALAHVISRAPGVLSASVEEQVMPLCNYLKDTLGNRGMGAIIRYPPIVETSPSLLQRGFEVLKSVGASNEECCFFLREFPELLVKFATIFEQFNTSYSGLDSSEVEEELNVRTDVAAQIGTEGSKDLRSIDAAPELEISSSSQSEHRERAEQVLFFVRGLKTGSTSGWDMKIAETELRMLLEALEKRNR